MTTLNGIRIQRDVLALESSIASNALSNLSNLVSSFGDFISATANFSVSSNAGVIALNTNQRDFLSMVDKISFRDMEQITAYVPEGLNTTYLKYIEELDPSVDHCVENTMNILSSLATYISNLINNNHALLETHSFANKLAVHERERGVLNADIGKCFTKGSTKAECRLGNVIDRNNDWKTVFEEMTILNRSIDSVDKNKLYKKMNDVNELLEVFKRKFNNGEITDVSPEVSANLSNLLFQAASELEFFSVTFFRVLGLTTSINRTMDYAQKIFKQ